MRNRKIQNIGLNWKFEKVEKLKIGQNGENGKKWEIGKFKILDEIENSKIQFGHLWKNLKIGKKLRIEKNWKFEKLETPEIENWIKLKIENWNNWNNWKLDQWKKLEK